jgi:hypothetical protein
VPEPNPELTAPNPWAVPDEVPKPVFEPKPKAVGVGEVAPNPAFGAEVFPNPELVPNPVFVAEVPNVGFVPNPELSPTVPNPEFVPEVPNPVLLVPNPPKLGVEEGVPNIFVVGFTFF